VGKVLAVDLPKLEERLTENGDKAFISSQ
jgi:hypothetical protein